MTAPLSLNSLHVRSFLCFYEFHISLPEPSIPFHHSFLGIGMQGAARERAVGKEYASGELLDKVMICVVTQREEVNDVVSVIIESARTGEIGDGKVSRPFLFCVFLFCVFIFN